MRPVLEGAVLAAVERNAASRQIEILMQILSAQEDANLLIDGNGEILFANARGEEVLSLHTEQPLARLPNGGPPAPLLSLIVAEMARLRDSDERVLRQTLITGDGGRWRLEIVALSGLGNVSFALVVLAPVRLPEYTVKDHLKHAYAKLGISSRGQLLSRLAEVVPAAR